MFTFTQLKAVVALTMLLTIAGLTWGVKHQTNLLIQARSERDVALATAAANEEAAKTLAGARDRDLATLRTLDANLRKQKDMAAAAVEQLEELKRNEAMVQADPNGVRDRINDRLRRLFVDLSCSSGRASADCAGSTAPAGASEPTTSRSPGPRPQ